MVLLTALFGLESAANHGWLHPEEHSRAPHFLEWVQSLDSLGDWSQSHLLTTLANGRSVRMTAHAPVGENSALIHLNGDMRWVVQSSDPMKNESQSFVEGYNGGALDFVWQGHLHSLGGYGLWRRHFDLIRFHGGRQAWQKVSVEGDEPGERMSPDETVCFFSHGKAWVFVDPLTRVGVDGEFNYICFELDVETRSWSRRGLIDPRLGKIKTAYNLPSGGLMLNAAGELIWVDFMEKTAKLLSNRSALFEAFSSWHNEDGRITVVRDSTLEHFWNGERMAFQIPWEELQEASAIPWIVNDVDANKAISNDEEFREEEPNGLSLATVLPWLVVLVLLGWLRLERRKHVANSGSRASVEVAVPEENAQGQRARYSTLTQVMLSHVGKQFETEELDELLGITHLSSPETLRSQRARLIQRVNTEHRVTTGQDLIVRKRSYTDRRRSVYVIGEVPEGAESSSDSTDK